MLAGESERVQESGLGVGVGEGLGVGVLGPTVGVAEGVGVDVGVGVGVGSGQFGLDEFGVGSTWHHLLLLSLDQDLSLTEDSNDVLSFSVLSPFSRRTSSPLLLRKAVDR